MFPAYFETTYTFGRALISGRARCPALVLAFLHDRRHRCACRGIGVTFLVLKHGAPPAHAACQVPCSPSARPSGYRRPQRAAHRRANGADRFTSCPSSTSTAHRESAGSGGYGGRELSVSSAIASFRISAAVLNRGIHAAFGHRACPSRRGY